MPDHTRLGLRSLVVLSAFMLSVAVGLLVGPSPEVVLAHN